MFFSSFSIAITSHGEERANLSAFRTFVRFALIWFLSVSSSSWCLGRAAACDCGTPWTFLLSFFLPHWVSAFILGPGLKKVCPDHGRLLFFFNLHSPLSIIIQGKCKHQLYYFIILLYSSTIKDCKSKRQYAYNLYLPYIK